MRNAFPIALALLFVAATSLVGRPAAAQSPTPSATIENGSGSLVLETYADGGLYAPGIFGPTTPADSIPATGSGTRLMWYPAKAAFRAGQVGVNKDGTQWDASKVGNHSVAFGRDTEASGDRSVAMGTATTASDSWTVAMGKSTTASNLAATAIGEFTTASGSQSFAAGEQAAAEDSDSFVWNDASTYHAIPNTANDGLSSSTAVNGEPVTGSNTFSVSAQGGVRFITGASSVTYIDGGTAGWSNTSTRAAKTNVTSIDPIAVLNAVEGMPISTWEYKTESGEGQGARHIGPMAEDFHENLPYDLGSSEDHINSLNADGVALGAVKGLAQKVERQQATIDSLRERVRKIEDVKQRLAAVEARQAAHASRAAGWPGGPLGLLLAALFGGLGTAGALRLCQ